MGGQESKPLRMSEEFESTGLIEAIMEALKRKDVSMIGICGLDGVVGTRLATIIRDRMKKEKLFKFHLSGRFEETTNEVLSSLIGKENILVVLDDVPEFCDLNRLGILLQLLKGSCKLVLTSQYDGVFTTMGAHTFFKPTLDKELWVLYRDKPSPGLYPLARPVADGLKGLASATTGLDRISRDNILAANFRNLLPYRSETVLQGSVQSFPELSNQATTSDTGGNSQQKMNEKSIVVEENERQKEEMSHNAKLVSMDDLLYDKGCVKDHILFCSIFPEDYLFSKDMLVSQWMAGGFIKLAEEEIVEEQYMQCFDALLNLGYIVAVGCDVTFDQMRYKFGDKMTAFLQRQNLEPRFLNYLDNEHVDVAKVEHLSLASKDVDNVDFGVIKQCSHLQTLTIYRCSGSKMQRLLPNLFLELKALKILNLIHTDIDLLPGSIEHLKEMRYLDISGTQIMGLPNSICCCSSLHTLILDHCSCLHKLPESMNKLIKLRHLVVDVSLLDTMPIGIGNLSKLRTLGAFMVGVENGRRIGELKDLNQLKGLLHLLHLENVKTKEEAEQACLHNKQNLTKIELRWNDPRDEKNTDDEKVLESLQPPSGIQELQVISYRGGVLTSWMGNPIFKELVSISLYFCNYCDSLPSLGELPSLKILYIYGNNELIEIDRFFCRKQTNQHYLAFPKLEKLTFSSLSKLEKWTGLEKGDFPSLNYLKMESCPKIVDLPFLSHLSSLSRMVLSYCPELPCLPERGLPPTLEALRIRGCPKLKGRCFNEQCEDWSKVAHVRDLYIDGKKVSPLL